MTTKSKREELFDLTDNVVDAILNMSDEEILADLEEDGITAEEAGRAFDSLLDSARMKAGRNALARARDEMNADRMASCHGRVVTATEARVIGARIAREQPSLTQAARNACEGPMSDREVLDLLEDFRELGVALPGEGDP